MDSRLLYHLYLAAGYGELGREEEARAEAAEVLKISPQFSLEGARQRTPYKDPVDLERLIDQLRKAGLEQRFEYLEGLRNCGHKKKNPLDFLDPQIYFLRIKDPKGDSYRYAEIRLTGSVGSTG